MKGNLPAQSKHMTAKNQNSKGLQKAQGIGNPMHKRLYTLREAAIYLGRPLFSVRTLIWNGRLPFVKDGRRQYVDIYDLDAYINKNKQVML